MTAALLVAVGTFLLVYLSLTSLAVELLRRRIKTLEQQVDGLITLEQER